MSRLRARAPELAAALVGLGWFLVLGGWRALPPSSFGWLRGDWAQHALGWLFFRRSPWGFPLGLTEGYVWPVATTVGFTDSNPLVALPGKLVSPLLPRDFQYIGLWLAACFALQGWFGARLAAAVGARPLDRLLTGGLLALAPPLTRRVGHDTLCAHFALLCLLALHLRPLADGAAARRALRVAGALAVVLAAVHPYLSAMAFALAIALAVKLSASDGLLPGRLAARAVGAALLGMAAVLGALGYLTVAPSHGGGFGTFSSDLLTFANPMEASWLVPQLPVAEVGWGEGSAYLGLGGLALAALAAALLARARPAPRTVRALAPLLATCGLMALFALGSRWMLGGRQVVDLRALYGRIGGVIGPFRSSGRFIWPLHYVLAGGAALVILRRLSHRPRLASAALAAALALQAVELAPRALGRYFVEEPWRLRDPAWQLARGRYRHLALAPPSITSAGVRCGVREYGDGDGDGWVPFADLAYTLGLTVNSGYLARGSERLYDPVCRALDDELARGVLRPDTIYLPHPSRLPLLLRAGARCGRLEGHDVCVPPGDGAFASALGTAAVTRH